MTDLPDCPVTALDLDAIAEAEGRVVVFAEGPDRLDRAARRVNRLTKGALARLLESDGWGKAKPGEAQSMAFPVGLAAESLVVVKLPRKADALTARRAGAAIARAVGARPALVLAGAIAAAEQVALGAMLRAYAFRDCKSAGEDDDDDAPGPFTFAVPKPEALAERVLAMRPLAEGVAFTRDLVNLPANILTTTTFADRLMALTALGVEVEVLEEADLRREGMEMMLAVGEGSDSPSKMVVMRWNGGEAGAAPLALVGKGVVFDTGGISIKPAGGMEDMTMDMGGAGVVAGTMQALAARGAKANVVGLVGLVENMPSGRAQRPGDVVTSMKGDTVEVINTDAEGRLVLGDVMWYAHERFAPAAMVDLATLTGAMLVALGHDRAGVFSNDDTFAGAFLAAAEAEGEGAWRMPLGPSYAKLLKSQIADVKNVGGRWAGSITAAEFLHRFVKEGCPWIHIDIAGVTKPASEPDLAPKGASGWGVLALDRLVRDRFEG
ncbi:leucyl aminopeptidase [Rhodovulum sp. 12E13]|uniref:leucyl aminopeptidase n=1 Tax=Rhodovulum sp. 12E13 TaxID=2203891 RepID=UPI001F2CEF64|nr:leucyl aminopeptidase [Rhodovulum sp. 12E13]